MLSFDLDGTLIRKGFDDIFWNELIPQLYAERSGLGLEQAKKLILAEYERISPDDPRWYIPEYWFGRFDLSGSIPDLLARVRYAEGIYDDVSLLGRLGRKYRTVISTNNPRVILEHKLRVLKDAGGFISRTFSSVSDFNGIVKGREFYAAVCTGLGIRPEQMLHVGDDPRYDLEVPRSLGINALLIDREKRNKGGQVIHSLEELVSILDLRPRRL